MPLTQRQLETQVIYRLDGARLNTRVPPNQIAANECSELYGVDGRYTGCLRKFYGMTETVRFAEVTGMEAVDDYAGVSFMQQVTFQKRGTSTTYRGFVVRWDALNDVANLEVCLVYTVNNGSSWTRLAIWSGAATGISGSSDIECIMDRGYLMVAVDGKATKTVYWTGSALTVVDSGPGSFGVELAVMTETAGTQLENASYYLRGDGAYMVAWRFYDSTRGIFSGLSGLTTVIMNVPKLNKAYGAVAFNASGGNSGLFIDGDKVTVNGRVFEADNNSAITGHVAVTITGLTTITQHAQALADAVNGDSANCACKARAESASVYVEALAAGTTGNSYTLSKTEAGASTDDLTVSGTTLSGGGVATTDYVSQCKVTLDFPANGAVVSGKVYADFAALFDTVQVLRSIDLGSSIASQAGAILHVEQSITKAGSWATSGAWDSLQVTIGTVPDEALPVYEMYDPEEDILEVPPQSGTIGRYQGITFMAQAQSASNPYDTKHSSLNHVSPEYFTTYNTWKGDPNRGRPLRYLQAGDSMFILCPSGITHVYKSSQTKPLQFVDIAAKMGLDAKWAAHSVGNSIVFIAGNSIAMMSGNDANIATVSAFTRTLNDDWVSDIASYVSSGYDKKLKASFFLDSNRHEMLALWHETGGVSMFKAAPFAWMTGGPSIATGKDTQVYFVTAKGLVVTPDLTATGGGTMTGLSASFTLNGSASSTGTDTITDSAATFHADMIGSYVFLISGSNAGSCKLISGVDVGNKKLTAASAFNSTVQPGDKYAVSPVYFGARLAPIRQMDIPTVLLSFSRVKTDRIQVKSRRISGLTTDVNDAVRVGVYRNSGAALESVTAEVDLTTNPAEAAENLVIDGIDIEPYIEYIGSGTKFEITDVGIDVVVTETRKVET